ncbi:DUF362 domain-containing protein, partial [bacterium]|nr:DUF362 domain-containing protein [bacterium]
WGIQGREQAVKDYSAPINLSNGAVTEYPPAQVTDADYLINMPTLKSHEASTGGNNNNDTDTRAEFPSLCAKNHFGSFCGGAGNLHPYQEATNYYATYHCYVDLMEHKHLGGKTMLYVIDGLYGGLGHWDAIPAKWWIPPFNTNWPGSVFASQDHCAIDSVGLDFLAAERAAKADVMRGKLDNHLHEAANITNPPSGIVYDPDGDGPATRSLGVHEHWLDLESKLYSKNIDPRVNGIELVDASVIEPLSCAFVANVTSVGIGSPVIFTATVTSTFSRNVYCRWDFNNDGTTDLEGPYLLEVTNAFPTQMYFSVKLDMSNEVAETASMLRPNYINVVPEPVAAALLLLASCAVRRMTRA